MTTAPSRRIMSIALAEVVSGTITDTGILNMRPQYATAIPALPPDEHTNCFTPRFTCVAHAFPIPRSLNDPIGCADSILSQTLRQSFCDSGSDLMSGVRVCRELLFIDSCFWPKFLQIGSPCSISDKMRVTSGTIFPLRNPLSPIVRDGNAPAERTRAGRKNGPLDRVRLASNPPSRCKCRT